MKLITIKESEHSSDLVVLKSRLEAEGIRCIIDGELSSQVLNHVPLIRAKLKVREADLKLVEKILIQTDSSEIQVYQEIKCPKCGSKKYRVIRNANELWKLAGDFFLALITLVPFRRTIQNRKFICLRCEHAFSGKDLIANQKE
jgi:DNA-directed RNA polymerase subunit RPC12/RpoP